MLGDINHCFNTGTFSFNRKINPDIKRNIYLIYKEILNNIVKHAKADKLEILISEENYYFILSVKDNGKGFNTSKIEAGNGLRNLRVRANQIHGELTIDSQLEKGTYIQLKVPI